MQIHEVTSPEQINEALGQTIKNVVTAPIKTAQAAGQAIGGMAGRAVGAAQQAAGSAASPFQKMKQAYGQAKTGAKAAGVAGKAQTTWETYVQNLAATQPTTPQTLETALRAFVQKNLLGDLKYQYNNLTNVDQIEAVIKQIVDPANANNQSQLWTQLVKTVGVSQAGGQAPGTPAASGAKKSTANAGGVGANPADIARAIQAAGVDPKVYANIGKVLKQASGTGAVPSTGNPVMDAFLTSLGFTIQ